jgi:transcriptional regulator with XRE-family HTH domain
MSTTTSLDSRPDRRVLSRLDTAELVRVVRQLAGLSQVELARRVGTKQPTVSRWERGIETPRVDTLARILKACGFEADLRFRRHDDVDRSQIATHLDMSPEGRVAYHQGMHRFVRDVRQEQRRTT